LSQAGLASRQISLGLENMRHARHGLPPSEDFSHLEANWRWKQQLEILGEMRRRADTILLGNTQLAPDMRAELVRTGVMEVTIQARDWWQIFLALAGRARLVVFYIEKATPNLVREMAHIRDHGTGYVVLGAREEIDELARMPDVGEAFALRARLVAGVHDLARLRPLLDELLGPVRSSN
jgi:hypothetical protein